MNLTITLSGEGERRLRASAARSGMPVEDYAREVLERREEESEDNWVDTDFLDDCVPDAAAPEVTLEMVRAATSKIRGSMAEAIIADREDR